MKKNKKDKRYIVKLENIGIESYNYVKNNKGFLTKKRTKAKLFKSRNRAVEAASKSREIYGDLFNTSRILESASNVINEYNEASQARIFFI